MTANSHLRTLQVTDTLASYPPAVRRVLPGVEHRRHKGLNNRAENSHRPTRRRERAMQRFKSPDQAQRFLACFEPIRGHFCPHRHLLPAVRYREVLAARFHTWHQVTGLAASACGLTARCAIVGVPDRVGGPPQHTMRQVDLT